MLIWLQNVLTWVAWTLAFWIIVALGVGILLGQTIRHRDRQQPTIPLSPIEVDCRFAALTGVTAPAPRESSSDLFRDGTR